MQPSTTIALAEESDLLAALRAGEAAAFAELVGRYGGRLLGAARRLLQNEEDARDALQDGFVSAFQALDRFDGRAQLSTWLQRIVINAALQKLRRQKRQPHRSIDDFLPTFLDDGHQTRDSRPWRETADAALQRQETRERVRQAIALLPENYRTVLLLRDIEELDTEETAALLGVTVPVVKTRSHRARQALRGLLDPYFSEAP
jgi:RNA polymerase sigma-70 factor (ECF subfamily)